jgi:transcriptional regulator with XRE-family HTH domain
LKRIDLARAAKVTRAYITQLETGERKNPSLDVLKRLARALGVPMTELLE